MRKFLIGVTVVLAISAIVYLRIRSHRAKAGLEDAYAGNRQVTLWSSTAQIRSPVATANFGDHLAVLSRYSDQVQVRTSGGIVGWVEAEDLLTAALWQQAQQLEAKAATLPVEARGHTRVLANMHLDASRDSPRLRQLKRDVPIDLFERRVELVAGPSAPQTPATPPAAAPKSDGATEQPSVAGPKKEDWWLVRAHMPDKTTESGWILGRFVDLDVPAPLPDYASAAGMRPVAWFELSRVTDSAGATKPQYLLVGTRGGVGQACDFTTLRVFTWGNQRARYETAFVDSNMCGKLPVTLTPAKTGSDVSFAFRDFSDGAPVSRVYRMHQTIVRRERVGTPPTSGKHAPTLKVAAHKTTRKGARKSSAKKPSKKLSKKLRKNN